MTTASKIEWTEKTWNPVAGCSLVSPGCTNCYAMKMAARLEAMGHDHLYYEETAGGHSNDADPVANARTDRRPRHLVSERPRAEPDARRNLDNLVDRVETDLRHGRRHPLLHLGPPLRDLVAQQADRAHTQRGDDRDLQNKTDR